MKISTFQFSVLILVVFYNGVKTNVIIDAVKKSLETQNREKRQLGLCSTGTPALSACFTGDGCGAGYVCEMQTGGDGRGRCCSASFSAGVISPAIVSPAVISPAVIGNSVLGVLPVGALLGECSWGQPAEGSCFRRGSELFCYQPYVCDPLAGNDGRGRCCLLAPGGQSSAVIMPNPVVVPGGGLLPIGGLLAGVGLGACPFNAPAAGIACSAVQPCVQGYLCINGKCCQQAALRCSNSFTVPVAICINGQCSQFTESGVYQAQRCEQPYNLCCPV